MKEYETTMLVFKDRVREPEKIVELLKQNFASKKEYANVEMWVYNDNLIVIVIPGTWPICKKDYKPCEWIYEVYGEVFFDRCVKSVLDLDFERDDLTHYYFVQNRFFDFLRAEFLKQSIGGVNNGN